MNQCFLKYNISEKAVRPMDDLKKKTIAAPAEMSAEEVMQKFDKESNKREPDGFWGYVISAICILFACFQLYTGIFGVLDAHLQRTIHLCFGMALIYRNDVHFLSI